MTWHKRTQTRYTFLPLDQRMTCKSTNVKTKQNPYCITTKAAKNKTSSNLKHEIKEVHTFYGEGKTTNTLLGRQHYTRRNVMRVWGGQFVHYKTMKAPFYFERSNCWQSNCNWSVCCDLIPGENERLLCFWRPAQCEWCLRHKNPPTDAQLMSCVVLGGFGFSIFFLKRLLTP